MKSWRDSWVIGGAVVVLLFGMPLAGAAIKNFNDRPETTCETSPISFERQTIDDSNLVIGQTELRQTGVDGQQKICTEDELEVSRTELLTAIPEITANGKKEPPVIPLPVYTPRYRTSATCVDGSHSYATGQGACSWHGGVYEWLYE